MPKHIIERCAGPNCKSMASEGRRAFCATCYLCFLEACTANGSLTRQARDAELQKLRTPPLPKWTYEGREDELAAACEQDEIDAPNP
jgi:hypothetical protein